MNAPLKKITHLGCRTSHYLIFVHLQEISFFSSEGTHTATTHLLKVKMGRCPHSVKRIQKSVTHHENCKDFEYCVTYTTKCHQKRVNRSGEIPLWIKQQQKKLTLDSHDVRTRRQKKKSLLTETVNRS